MDLPDRAYSGHIGGDVDLPDHRTGSYRGWCGPARPGALSHIGDDMDLQDRVYRVIQGVVWICRTGPGYYTRFLREVR